MALRRYLLFSFLFVLLVALYLFSFVSGEYTLSITPLHFDLTLSIATWIIGLMLFLVIVSALHMSFYASKNFFALRRIKADNEVMVKAIRSALLQENKKYKYKSDLFKVPGEVLSSVVLKIAPNFFSSDEDFVKIANALKEIDGGKYVDISEYRLSLDNPIAIQNDLNKLKVEPKFAEKILKKELAQTNILSIEAFKVYASYAPLADILRMDMPITKEVFETLIDRYVDKEIELTREKIGVFVSSIELSEDDFLAMAKKLKKIMAPDELIVTFEEFYDKYAQSASAFIYILFELQMLDKVSDVLQNASEGEFAKYRYLFELRESGKSFDIDLFV